MTFNLYQLLLVHIYKEGEIMLYETIRFIIQNYLSLKPTLSKIDIADGEILVEIEETES